jgi:hypothetical protein
MDLVPHVVERADGQRRREQTEQGDMHPHRFIVTEAAWRR